ncbi:hypothetical protein ACWFNE_08400 [Cellulomonas sp. NPDC055163]
MSRSVRTRPPAVASVHHDGPGDHEPGRDPGAGLPAGTRLLDPFRGVRVAVAVDSRPWELPIDSIVISVGADGYGHLGMAVHSAVPGAAWEKQRPDLVTPDSPAVLDVAPDDAAVRTGLRRVILACARDSSLASAPFGEGPGTLDAVRRATGSAVALALDSGARALGLPLLGTGLIRLPPTEVAFEAVAAVRAALQEHPYPDLRLLVFVTLDPTAGRAVERVWGYRRLLTDAVDRALRDPGLRADAERAGLPQAALVSALAVPEDRLWQPCVSELADLRHVDRRLDDLRADLVPRLATPSAATAPPRTTGPLTGPAGRRVADGEQDDLSDAEELLRRDPVWLELVAERELVLRRLRSTLLHESVLPLARGAINEALELSRRADVVGRREVFGAPLPHVDASGLRGRPRAGALVHTEAHEELAAYLDPARAARVSLGVAGPRGCGKSTLLQEVVDGWTHGLAVTVPAPASYASRDFLLHLYGRVCEQVLDRDGDRRVRRRDLGEAPARAQAASLLQLVLAPALAALVGAVLLAAGGGAPATGLPVVGAAVLVATGVVLALSARTGRRSRRRGRSTHVGDGTRGLRRHGGLRPGRRLPGAAQLLAVAAAVSAVAVAASLLGVPGVRAAGAGLLVGALGGAVLGRGPTAAAEGAGSSGAGPRRPALRERDHLVRMSIPFYINRSPPLYAALVTAYGEGASTRNQSQRGDR